MITDLAASLEAAVRAGDAAARQAYADYLEEQGDPRARLLRSRVLPLPLARGTRPYSHINRRVFSWSCRYFGRLRQHRRIYVVSETGQRNRRSCVRDCRGESRRGSVSRSW